MTDRSASGALLSLLRKVASAPASAPAPAPGDVIGRYQLVRELGEGGFGVVYEARDRELNRAVALKLLRPDDTDDESRRFERFEREARAMARLAHPNIVTLHDYGDADGRPYLVLELLRGHTLADALRDGPLTPARATAIALAVARALNHAHRAGVIHLDLKPSNVFLGEDNHVTVLDFGLARLLPPRTAGSSRTRTTMSSAAGLRGAGTPAFMAPEQERGATTDARTDVFAAGVLLFAMLTGELPFAISATEADRVMRPAGPALRAVRPALPEPLVALVVRALADAPAARFADGGALVEALRAAQPAPVAPRPRRRRAAAIGLAVAVVALAAAALAWWHASGSHGSSGRWQIELPARSTWRDTGISVHAGQLLTIRADGEVCTKPDEMCAGPDGQPRINEWALPGLESTGIGMLVGRIAGHELELGSQRTLRAADTGTLWLGINDRDGSNNTGSGFAVHVELR